MTTARGPRPFRRTAVAALVVLGLAAAACGGDDDDATPDPPAAEATTTTDAARAATTAPAGAPDPTTPADEPATTEPVSETTAPTETDGGKYAPQPLPERATVRIGLSAPLEYAAPLTFAEHFGEFEKENLDVEIVITQDSLTAMTAGDIDGTYGAPSAGFINAIAAGLDQRWVAGNYTSPADSLSGLWMRKEVVGDPPDLSKLAGTTTSNSQTGGVVTYFIDELLTGTGVTIDQLNFEKLAPADTLAALVNGALDGAWLIDPLYKEIENDPSLVFVGGQPLGEVGGGMIYGPPLLDPANEAVGTAVLRAMRRAMDTYLQPGYKSDPEIVALLAELGGMPEESVLASDELQFDMTIADGLATRMQESWIRLGLIESGEAIPEDQVVDRRFVEAVEAP